MGCMQAWVVEELFFPGSSWVAHITKLAHRHHKWAVHTKHLKPIACDFHNPNLLRAQRVRFSCEELYHKAANRLCQFHKLAHEIALITNRSCYWDRVDLWTLNDLCVLISIRLCFQCTFAGRWTTTHMAMIAKISYTERSTKNFTLFVTWCWQMKMEHVENAMKNSLVYI